MMRRRAYLQMALDDLTRHREGPQKRAKDECRDAIAKEIERLTVEIEVSKRQEPAASWTFMEIVECDLANGQPA